MKAISFVKAALLLVALTALLYWREVWAWVSAKTWAELSGDILGFVLKWFFLSIFAFLAANIPHYLTPWLRLMRKNARRQLKATKRGRGGVPVSPTRLSRWGASNDASALTGASQKQSPRLVEEDHTRLDF